MRVKGQVKMKAPRDHFLYMNKTILLQNVIPIYITSLLLRLREL